MTLTPYSSIPQLDAVLLLRSPAGLAKASLPLSHTAVSMGRPLVYLKVARIYGIQQPLLGLLPYDLYQGTQLNAVLLLRQALGLRLYSIDTA